MTYIRLAKAPCMVVIGPKCSACWVDLESDGGWACPVCGSTWSENAWDGEEGVLYEQWDDLGDIVDDDAAAQAGRQYEKDRNPWLQAIKRRAGL